MASIATGAGLVAGILLFLVISWLVGSIMTAGRHSQVTPAVPPALDLKIITQDDVEIVATFRPGRDDHAPGVLLLHGVRASREATAENAVWLARLGYATLTIDFRGHGQSDMRVRTFGLREAQDATVAFNWIKSRQNDAPVAIIGISLGGAASLLGDKGAIPADALVLQAVYPDIRRAIRNRIASRTFGIVGTFIEPFLSFQALLRFGAWPSRLSPLKALAGYRGPMLIIGGEQDRSTPPSETREMFAAAPGQRQLWLVPRGDHAAICDLADAEYRHHIRDFLEQTIGQVDGPKPTVAA